MSVASNSDFQPQSVSHWSIVRLRELLLAGYTLGMFFWLAACLVRLTVRDLSGFTPLAIVYYAAPGVLLMLVAFGLSLLAVVLRRQAGAVHWAFLGLIVATCAGSNRHLDRPVIPEPASTLSPVHRLFFWNVGHGEAGWKRIAKQIASQNADLITLVEAGPPTEQMRKFWETQFPQHEVTLLGGEMILLVKGVAHEVRARSIGVEGQMREVDVEIDGRFLTAVIVDIHGRPTNPRKESLEELAARLSELEDRPVIIAGDFNTPRESPLFQPLDHLNRNAFDQVGTGYEPTWPRLFPLLKIDQIWGNTQIQFTRCDSPLLTASDHCPLLTEFRF